MGSFALTTELRDPEQGESGQGTAPGTRGEAGRAQPTGAVPDPRPSTRTHRDKAPRHLTRGAAVARFQGKGSKVKVKIHGKGSKVFLRPIYAPYTPHIYIYICILVCACAYTCTE